MMATLMIGGVTAYAQSKQISKTAQIGKDVTVSLKFNQFDVDVKTWSKQELKVDYFIDASAKSADELAGFYAKFEQVLNDQLKSISSGRVQAGNIFSHINKKNNKVSLTFKSGEQFSLTKFEGEIEVFMPKSNKLSIRSSFNEVNIADLDADVKIELNSARLTMGDCFELELKTGFSKNMKIGTVNSANMNLNSSDADIEHIKGDLDLDASFSNIEIQQLDGDAVLNMNSSSFIGGDIKNLEVNGSFVRTLKVGKVETAEVTFNSSNLTAKSIAQLEIDKASFSTFTIDQVKDIGMNSSSSSKFYLENVGSVYCGSCSFTSFKIDNLAKSFVAKAQSGDVDIQTVEPNFEEIDIKGSFLTTRIDITEGSNYLIEADLSFGSSEFQGAQFDYRDKEHSKEKLKGWKGDKDKAKARVNLDCQSCKIMIY